MVFAKDEFLQRMDSFSRSLESEAVQQKALIPENRNHNEVAKMLRNGLAVVGFTALEDFIKKRASEVVSEVGGRAIEFDSLPTKLQKASTLGLIKALNFQLNQIESSSQISYVQDHSQMIASTANNSLIYDISPKIYGYDKSNISTDTVKDILSGFNIDDPWKNMRSLASRLSLVTLPLDETFKNAAQRRHRAAHVASADTPKSELEQFVKEAYAISLSYDVLLTKGLYRLHDISSKLNHNEIRFRYLSFNSNTWSEKVEGSSKATKNTKDYSVALNLAEQRAASNKDILVCFESSGSIKHWSTYC